MLKQIDNAQLHCIYSDVDVKIQYDDGKWFKRDDPKIKKFTRRKRKAINVAAIFVITLEVGKFAWPVREKNMLDYVTIPLEDNHPSIDDVLLSRANEILNERIRIKSENEPYLFDWEDEYYWLYKGNFYRDKTKLKADEVKALILTKKRMQRARINRALTIANTPETPIEEQRRGFIPEDVRLLVWERDGGKCSKCGARTELQFDHVIPFSMGGSSTADNLQILCGSCNRTKSNSIA